MSKGTQVYRDAFALCRLAIRTLKETPFDIRRDLKRKAPLRKHDAPSGLRKSDYVAFLLKKVGYTKATKDEY